jgi:GNAT superfamily N-acetyltransferase
MSDLKVRVTYLELTQRPAPIPARCGDERVSREKLPLDEYLDLYRQVGRPLRWDQRLNMSQSELTRLLESEHSHIYVLRDGHGAGLGFCEFERYMPEIELKNFGLIPTAQRKGLGSWLLRTALHLDHAATASSPVPDRLAHGARLALPLRAPAR